MELIDFYRRVLPDRGTYCLVAPRMMHHWYDTLEEMIAATEKRVANEPNWYYATNSFDGTKSRKQENVVAAKSLRLDIDAGPEKVAKHGIHKVYESQEDALAHLAEFTAWAGIAPSIIVSSGAGLHVYYCFDETLEPNVWQAAAGALERMTRHFKLKVDTTTTLDAARILRPIGALHKNGSYVEVLEEGDDITPVQFLQAVKALNLPKEAPRTHKLISVGINADLEGPEPIYAASSIKKAAAKCGWLGDMLAANGNVGYDDWFHTIGAIKHCVEGLEFAQEWSSGHDEYSASETLYKFETWNYGPPRCTSIADRLNSPRCTTCAYRTKVNTPIQLGRLSDTEAEAVKKAEAQAEMEAFGGFTSFDGEEDAAPQLSSLAAAMGETATTEDGEEMITLTGKAAPKEVYAAAKKYDQWEKLRRENVLPEQFPPMEALMEYCKSGLFFVQRSNAGRLVLYVYEKVVTELEDGGKSTSWRARPLTEQPFYIQGYAQGSGQSETVIEYMTQYNKDGQPEWQFAEVPTTSLYDTAGIRDNFANLGIAFADAGESTTIFKMLQRYISANLSVLRNRPSTLQIQHHMGFQFQNRKPVYVQGAYAVGIDGKVQTCSLSADLRKMKNRFEMPCISSDALRAYTGDKAYEQYILPSARQYCEGIRLLYGREEDARFQLGWLLGVSSSYMTFFTDEEPSPDTDTMPGMGIALAFYSAASGSGKTTLQRVISEAFSHAEENKAGGDRGSGISSISLGVQLSRLGCLPYMLDEVTNNEPEEVSEMIHKISIGRDKVRALQSGRAAERTGSWTSVTTMSTNVSQRVLLSQHRSSSNAEQMRVVELNFDGVKPGSMTDFVRTYNDYISANRGALGMVLGRYAVQNWDSMRRTALAMMDAVINKFKMPNSERYFAKIIAAAIMVSNVLKKEGLVPVDLTTVVREFGYVLDEARQYLAENTPQPDDYAERMVRDLMPRLVRTRTETDNRGSKMRGDEPVYDIVENPDVINRVKIAGRYVASTGRLYVVASEFNAWATKNALDARTLLETWKESGLYTPRGGSGAAPKRLNVGIHRNIMPDMNPRCYAFSLGHLAAKLDLTDGDIPNNVVDIGAAPAKAAPSASSDDGATYNEGAAE